MDVVENALNGVLLAYLSRQIIDFAVPGVFSSLIIVRQLWWHAIALLLLSSGPIGWLSRSLGWTPSSFSPIRAAFPGLRS